MRSVGIGRDLVSGAMRSVWRGAKTSLRIRGENREEVLSSGPQSYLP